MEGGDLSAMVSHNVRKARIALARLRPALTSGSLGVGTKARLVETFIKPILLYSLETGVVRIKDVAKLNAVLNKARRMILKIQSKCECKVVDLETKVRLRDISLELGVRRLNLWCAIVCLEG